MCVPAVLEFKRMGLRSGITSVYLEFKDTRNFRKERRGIILITEKFSLQRLSARMLGLKTHTNNYDGQTHAPHFLQAFLQIAGSNCNVLLVAEVRKTENLASLPPWHLSRKHVLQCHDFTWLNKYHRRDTHQSKSHLQISDKRIKNIMPYSRSQYRRVLRRVASLPRTFVPFTFTGRDATLSSVDQTLTF